MNDDIDGALSLLGSMLALAGGICSVVLLLSGLATDAPGRFATYAMGFYAGAYLIGVVRLARRPR